MTRRRRFLLSVSGLVLLSVWAFVVHPFLVIAASYSATVGAMQHFATGDSLETIASERIPSKIGFVRLSADVQERSVTARALYVSRTAWFRDRLGAARTERELAVEDLVPTPDENLPWPVGSSEEPETIPDYVDATTLFNALADAFQPERGTHAVVVVYEGALICERYRDGYDRRTPFLGWSMTKSVTATLLGRLIRNGELNLGDPVPIDAWRADDRATISFEDLLRMRSGLEFYQNHSNPFSDSLRMLFVDETCWERPVSMPLAHAPGTHWSYSDGTSNALARVVVEACGDDPTSRLACPQRLLFEPLGMDTAFIATDERGTFVGSSLMFASARDWARFGLLYARDGVWGDERLLPEGWVELCASPTEGSDSRYGAHFWRYPEGPAASAFSAQGYEGQYVWIDPTRDVVLVRLGTEPTPFDDRRFAETILTCFP